MGRPLSIEEVRQLNVKFANALRPPNEEDKAMDALAGINRCDECGGPLIVELPVFTCLNCGFCATLHIEEDYELLEPDTLEPV